MSISTDAEWYPGSAPGSHEKRVYRGGALIGRVRRHVAEIDGELIREWFTVERWTGGAYVPIEGTQPDVTEAMTRLVFYGVVQ